MELAGLIRGWPKIGYPDAGYKEQEEYKKSLHLLVARDYSWLVSELFDIEGDLGWGPGNRDDEEELFRDPMPSSYARMSSLLNTLNSVEKDDSLVRLVRVARTGNVSNSMELYVSRGLKAQKDNRKRLIIHIYNKISAGGHLYTIGGARIYFSLWTQQGRFELAFAGLVRLLYHPLDILKVKAMTAKMKWKKLHNRYEANGHVPAFVSR